MNTTPTDEVKPNPIEELRDLGKEIRTLLRRQVLGEDDFWSRYDVAADAYDKAQLHRQNDNLDVLLIFAGLFSAVNTAFIVLTIVDLSAPPSYKTELLLTLLVNRTDPTTLSANDFNPPFVPHTAAIRQNCLFFASLCSSVLSAAGAVLGKQWLGKFERTGQVGSHEAQGRLRTEKWYGSEEWGLQTVIEVLPNLLLISVGLFFAALVDYLWATRKPVAFVVIGFIGVGVLLYVVMLISAAIDKDCPFQTAPSGLIRKVIEKMRPVPSANSDAEAPLNDSRSTAPSGLIRKVIKKMRAIPLTNSNAELPLQDSGSPYKSVREWLSSRQHHGPSRPQDEVSSTALLAYARIRQRLVSNVQSIYAGAIELLRGRRSHGLPRPDVENTAPAETVGEPADPTPLDESQDEVAVKSTEDDGARVEKPSPWAWTKKVFKRAVSAAGLAESKVPAEDPVTPPRNSSQTMGLGEVQTAVDPKRKKDQKLSEMNSPIRERISAQSIVWMMENATNKRDLLSTAEMIPSLADREAVELIAHHKPLKRLIELFRVSLTKAVDNKATDGKTADTEGVDAKDALTFVRAVAHVLLADPENCLTMVREALQETHIEKLWTSHWKAQLVEPNLQALCVGMFIVTSTKETDPSLSTATGVAFEEMQRGNLEPTTIVAFSSLLTLSPFGLWGAILDDGMPKSDTLFSMVCLEIIERAKGQRRSISKRVRDLWRARDGINVLELMIEAFEVQSDQISEGQVRKTLLDLHTRLLSAFRQRSTQSYPSGREDFLKAVASHQFFISNVVETLDPMQDKPAEARAKWLFIEKRKASTNTPVEPTSTPKRRWDELKLLAWEDRVKQDPRVHTDSVPNEIRAYVAQLKSLLGDGREWWLRSTDGEVFIDAVGNTKATSVAVDKMLKDPTFPLADLKNDSTVPLSGLAPVIDYALSSDLPIVLAAVYKLLNTVGHDAWGENVGPHLGKSLVITSELGRAVVRSLSANAVKKDLFNFAAENHFDLEDLIYWLAESVKENSELGEEFARSGALSLFVSTIRRNPDWRVWARKYTWCILFLFLRVWTTITDEQKDPSPVEGLRETTLRDICEAFKSYMLGRPTWKHKDPTNVDIFRRSAMFIDDVYRLRPYLAMGLQLDHVRDEMKRASAEWWDATEVAPDWDAAGKLIPRVTASIAQVDGEEELLSAVNVNLFIDTVIGYKTELVGRTKAVEPWLTNPTFPLVDLLKSDSTYGTCSLTSIIICALESKTLPVFDAAYQLLGEIGSHAGDRESGQRDGKALIINVELARGVVQSLSANVVAKTQDFSLVSYAKEHGGVLEGLLFWLSESMHEAPELAMAIKSSGVVSLFFEGMAAIGRKEYASTTSEEDEMMWHLVFLYLRMWTASESQRSAEKSAGSQSYDEGAMSDAACELLGWYVQEHMINTLDESCRSDLDMVRETFAFIEQIFVVRPVAGLTFKLDDACNELISMIEDWDAEDNLETLWSGARETYQRIRQEQPTEKK
ncbi:hypothetical protein FRB96_008541 [Tulasnella sp. 330]|nr:hypothetical protein FRB96_008541 [Tulasnella sp. 330]